jgi:hypothetical protein
LLERIVEPANALLFEVGIVSHARVDDWVDRVSSSPAVGPLYGNSSTAAEFNKFVPLRLGVGSSGPRRTPRVSVILVLPDDQAIDTARLALRLPPGYEGVELTVVACAREPSKLDELKRTARDVRFLLAPPGTSAEDLREFAMEQTPGDIVTLLNAALLCAPLERDRVVTS